MQPPLTLPAHTLAALLRRYDSSHVGAPVTCERLSEGLLNRGYRLVTTRGRYFLKHHLEDAAATIVHQHTATARLAGLGLPVVPPVQDRTGGTVAVVDGSRFALHPWVEGRHRDGCALDVAQAHHLGGLLGRVHLGLAQVMATSTHQPRLNAVLPGPRRRRAKSQVMTAARTLTARPRPPAADDAHAPADTADATDTHALIDDLLARVLTRARPDGFDLLAAHRLRERRELLRRYAHWRPGDDQVPASGWVHGDFHPLNLLYAPVAPHEPVAIIDWDRLGVRPRSEEVVRAAVIFFLSPDGTLQLPKIRAYARAYRNTVGAERAELAHAVHRVWWERLNDFWMLRWHYQLGDSRTDRQFPAAAALVGWWTAEYARVRRAFCA